MNENSSFSSNKILCWRPTIFVSEYDLLDVEQTEKLGKKITTIIVVLADEGHQFIGCFNKVYMKLMERNLHLNIEHFIILGNYIEEHHLIERNGIKLSLIPFPHGPFEMFYGNKQLSFLKVVEPNNLPKSSKISFIYYGRRIERDIIFCELYKKNFMQNVIYHSDKKSSQNPCIEYADEKEFDLFGYNDFTTYNNIKNLLPKKIEQFDAYGSDYYSNTVRIASNSLFYLVSESNLGPMHDQYNVSVVTEKSATPFFSKTIPIFFTRDSVKTVIWFQNLGFDCFTDIIPIEVYKLNFLDKIKSILEIVENTDIDFFNKNLDRFNKNYRLTEQLVYHKHTIFSTIDNLSEKHNLLILKY